MGKKGGKKDKKGKKAKEEKLTPHEALLAHQIQMYQNTISETNDEIHILEIEKQNLTQQKMQLDYEKDQQVKSLIKEDRKMEQDAEQESQISHEQVKAAKIGHFLIK